MKNFISLGSNCSTKYHIDIYYKNFGSSRPSYFFDWLTSTTKDVIDVLKCKDISRKISKYKIKKIENKKFCNVIFENFEKLTSLHDLPINYNKIDFENFIIKRYIRRHIRLLNAIKTLDNIFFILREKIAEIEYDHLELLLNTIDNYKKGHKIFIVGEKKSFIINSRLKIICIDDFKIKECENYSFMEDNIDWISLINYLH